jgi:ectoine hydroxylase-related dioxygenase (phytanoyl-CoA dioxygenase family)
LQACFYLIFKEFLHKSGQKAAYIKNIVQVMAFLKDEMDSMVASFSQNGYAVIPQIVPVGLLAKLRQFFDEEMYQKENNKSLVINEVSSGRYISNIENLCEKDNLACLELLAQPFVLEPAAAICGPDFFPIQDFAVIKCLGDTTPVLWHQDMLHERKGQCCTMGIYLDDADANDGALRMVPGSHLSGATICQMSRQPFIEVPMKAGDILIHDMMLAHSSEPMTHNPLRRVIYFEFLSAAHVAVEAIYGAEIVERRTRLLEVAHGYRLTLDQTGPDLSGIRAVLAEIYSDWVKARPSAYCFENQNGMGGQ